MTKISLLIPNYNGAPHLEDTLTALAISVQNYPPLQIETLILDNDSTDSSRQIAKIIQKKYPLLHLQFISLDKNYGFASAVNQGIKRSRYPLIFILNNDLLLSPSWFTHVCREIQNNPDYSTYYALVLDRSGHRIESAGFKYFPSGRCQNLQNGQKYQKSTSTPTQIWGAPASAIIYKRAALRQVGLFDPRFFAYIEDVDLAYRLDKSKFKTLYIPTALSSHLGGATSQKMGNLRARLSYRNWYYFIIKNYTFSQFIRHFPEIFLERLKNLKYFYLSTPKYLFPFELIVVHFQICHYFVINLLKSTLDDYRH